MEQEGWDCAEEHKMSPGKGTSRKGWRKPAVPGKDTGKAFDESRYDVGLDAGGLWRSKGLRTWFGDRKWLLGMVGRVQSV